MRISTVTFQNDALQQMQSLQSAMSNTQAQLATSKRIQSAADDPAAMVQVNQLNTEISASQQFVTNGNGASTNLKLEEQAMADATNVLQSARDLAVEGNNAALTLAQRQDIASQLQQQLQQLVAIGNRTDSNGSFLFSGTASGTQPFTQGASSVSYQGAATVSQVQIAANQRISGGDTGATVFMNIPSGNGTFTTSITAGNTGTGSIGTGTVTNTSAWVPDTYTISFTSPTQYTVTNSVPATVTTGTFKDGDSIAFNGIQVPITGTPATGDSFTVAKAGTTSAFSALSSLVTTLNSTTNPAQLSTQMGGALQQIDATITNLNNVSASVGARINSITSALSSESTLQTNLKTSVSQLSDVDYASAITDLNTEELSLKAAQQTYASIAQLSLFNYIK